MNDAGSRDGALRSLNRAHRVEIGRNAKSSRSQVVTHRELLGSSHALRPKFGILQSGIANE